MLKHTATRSRRESGMAVIVTAISLLFLIPLVGLAIDGGVMFVVRARLGAALDSAALAAGRGLTSGTTQAAAETAGTTSATDFLLANFPNGYLNTSYSGNSSNNYGVTSSFSPNSIGTLGITITATINSPTYFMRWLGVNSIPVSATGSATRPNLVIVLVLDKSSSMGSRPSAEVGTMPTSVNYSTASSCEAMVYNANAFTQNFSPFDTVAEISFDATVSVDYAPSTNFKASGASGVSSAIANIQCGSNTNTTGALAQAAAVINAANQPAALNHIVLFTDGVANGVNAAFPVRTAASLGGAYDYRMSPGLPITGAGSSVANNTACGDTSGQSLCNMTTCATGGTTITGVITQVSGFSVTGGNMNMYPAFSQAYPYTSISASGDPALAVPAGCTSGSYSNFNNQGAVQMNLAYIPATDRFGNSTSSPWGDSTWDGVLEQVNSSTAPSGTPITPGNSATKNLTGLWSAYPTTGANTKIGAAAPGNRFPSGPFNGFFRPDLPNTIGITSMNTAVNEAIAIRTNAAAGTNPAGFANSTSKYTVTIDAIYLQGNGGDPVDPYFLQYLTNQQNLTVPSCIYTASTYPYTTTYTSNPHYATGQAQGAFVSTASTAELSAAFSQIAGSLLRITQ